MLRCCPNGVQRCRALPIIHGLYTLYTVYKYIIYNNYGTISLPHFVLFFWIPISAQQIRPSALHRMTSCWPHGAHYASPPLGRHRCLGGGLCSDALAFVQPVAQHPLMFVSVQHHKWDGGKEAIPPRFCTLHPWFRRFVTWREKGAADNSHKGEKQRHPPPTAPISDTWKFLTSWRAARFPVILAFVYGNIFLLVQVERGFQ